MKTPILAAAATLALLAIPASAQTPIPVRAFDAVELRGGGELFVRRGPQHRVTLVRGDPNQAAFHVREDGTLVVRPCRTSCRNQNLRVEIVTPELDAASIHGGGSIQVAGGFPAEASVALAIAGGGVIDARALPARSVAASVTGGGLIRAAPRSSLAAAITGGGTIRYTGDPAKTVHITGGGTVTRDR